MPGNKWFSWFTFYFDLR